MADQENEEDAKPYDPGLAILISFMYKYCAIGINARWDLHEEQMQKIEDLLKEYVDKWNAIEEYDPETISRIFNICQEMFKDSRNKK